MTLHLARGLDLPLEAVTQTFAILAKRGAGKTYTANVFVEQLIASDLPVIVVDPVGVWWGLRFGEDGKSPGFPVYVLGGEHADLPLEESAGAVVADFVVETRKPVVVDLSLFSKSASRRFMTDFAEVLYRKNRSALHLVLDEADTFIPQRIDHGGERLVGAINDLVRRGRARGLGVTLISQRPALINKDVLTQIEVLVALRMTGPQDRDAIERWIEHHADKSEGDKVLASLPSLEIGEAWVWSPGWLALFKRVKIAKRKTFDSSATPKVGERVRAPKDGAPVDLGALEQAMRATVERAKAEDPKALRARIAELEAGAKLRPNTGELAVANRLIEGLKLEIGQLRAGLQKRAQLIFDVRMALERADKALEPVQATPLPAATMANLAPRPRRSPPLVEMPASSSLSLGQTRVLTAIAQHAEGVTKEQLTVLTGYKRSTRDLYLQDLRRQGFLQRGQLAATPEGIAALGSDFAPLPTGEALRRHWLERLPAGERKVLEILVANYPKTIPRETVTEATGYRRSTRDLYLQKLASRKLVESFGGAGVRASAQLFGGAP